MSAFCISEVAIPATVDAPDAADFMAATAVRNAVEADSYGTDELACAAVELLPGWLDTRYQRRKMLVAWVDGRIVARGVFDALTEEPENAWVDVRVLPEFRGRGIGAALHEKLEQIGREDGRRKLICYAVSADRPGERLPSPTGFGSVPAGNPEVRFLLKHGYTLEQVERGSRLALPVPEADLQNRFRAASAAAGPDYLLHEWVDRTPERWRPDMAQLYTAMSVEEPSAGLEEPESVWTVDRLIDEEERAAGSGRLEFLMAAEHVPSGRLIAFTTLSLPPEITRPVNQLDTLVMPGHRGRRLGMLLKVANILALQRSHPGYPAITTFNAEENRHMLEVNEAVGFMPMGYEGAWKKVLDGSRA